VPTLAITPPCSGCFSVWGTPRRSAASCPPSRRRASPSQALKAGDEERAFAHLRSRCRGSAPSWSARGNRAAADRGLPLAGYTAIALLLVGTLMLLPRIAAIALSAFPTPRAATGALRCRSCAAHPGRSR
jgi:putative ABC transport system permease protein